MKLLIKLFAIAILPIASTRMRGMEKPPHEYDSSDHTQKQRFLHIPEAEIHRINSFCWAYMHPSKMKFDEQGIEFLHHEHKFIQYRMTWEDAHTQLKVLQDEPPKDIEGNITELTRRLDESKYTLMLTDSDKLIIAKKALRMFEYSQENTTLLPSSIYENRMQFREAFARGNWEKLLAFAAEQLLVWPHPRSHSTLNEFIKKTIALRIAWMLNYISKHNFYEHDVVEAQPCPPISAPDFSSIVIPTKEEKKIKKMHDRKALWDHVQSLRKTDDVENNSGLNSRISTPPFKDYTCTTAAAKHNCNLPILQLLDLYKADFNVTDGFKRTPLETAVIHHCARNVTFLIPRTANIKSLGLLHRICNPVQDVEKPGKNSRIETLKALLAAGIDPNETNSHGNTVWRLLLMHCYGAGLEDFWQTPDKDELNKKFLEQRKQMIKILLDAGLYPQVTAIAYLEDHHTSFHPELISFFGDQMKQRLGIKT